MQETYKMKQQIQDHLDYFSDVVLAKYPLAFWLLHGYRSERGQKGCQGMHFK